MEGIDATVIDLGTDDLRSFFDTQCNFYSVLLRRKHSSFHPREIRSKGISLFKYQQFLFSLGSKFPIEDSHENLGWYDCWIRVSLSPDANGRSYVYPAFGRAAPLRYRLYDLQLVDGPSLPELDEYKDDNASNRGAPYVFSSFTVGQGMASLVHNGTDGLLIDAGAGTPITRDAYIKNSLINNAFMPRILNLDKVKFFLSHGDSDHWRMLGWDLQVANKIDVYVVPSSMKSIAFFDKTLMGKVYKLSRHLPPISLGRQASLEVYRTVPRRATSNNDGLIVRFITNEKAVLAPGDCVYREMARDRDSQIVGLATSAYASVVVPHHGDRASAKKVPNCRGNGTAFFSAGNHRGYKHPNQESVTAHQQRGFNAFIPTCTPEICEKIIA